MGGWQRVDSSAPHCRLAPAGQTRFAVCPIPLRALGGFGRNPTGAGSSPGGAAGEVDSGDLQVASVDETSVECYAAVGAYLFVAAAPLAVVGAMSGELSPLVGRRVFLMQPLRHVIQQGVENI